MPAIGVVVQYVTILNSRVSPKGYGKLVFEVTMCYESTLLSRPLIQIYMLYLGI